MPGFIYFLPGLTAATDAELQKAGLGYALDGRRFAFGAISAGPDRGPGLLITIAGDDVPCAFKPDEQDWQLAPAGYYVGVSKIARPGERDLRRSKMRAAPYTVDLGNGDRWSVPIVRGTINKSSLPQFIRLGPDGQSYHYEPMPEFAGIIADAEKLWATIVEEKDGTYRVKMTTGLEFTEMFRIAIGALALNYRVGPAECSLLGLFTTGNLAAVGLAMIDFPSITAQATAAPTE